MDFSSPHFDVFLPVAAQRLGIAGLASLLDATLLKPDATAAQIQALVADALGRGANICVNESRIPFVLALREAQDAAPRTASVASVIAFPFGACSTEIKVAAALAVLRAGADEIDMVANTGLMKDGARGDWTADIEAVAAAVAEFNRANQADRLLKVIIETCLLNDEQKEFAAGSIAAIARSLNLGMFVKTSTGYGMPAAGTPVGATLEDVLLLRRAAGPYQREKNPVGVKAAGGIRDARAALAFAVACGAFDDDLQLFPEAWRAARIGTSSASTILEQFASL